MQTLTHGEVCPLARLADIAQGQALILLPSPSGSGGLIVAVPGVPPSVDPVELVELVRVAALVGRGLVDTASPELFGLFGAVWVAMATPAGDVVAVEVDAA